MKKLILITLLFAALTINAQVRTVIRSVDADATYYIYNGTANDVVNGTTVDTLQIQFFLQKDYPVQFYAKSDLSLVGTADTTLYLKLYGKVFIDDDWAKIDSTSFAGSVDGSVILSSQGLTSSTVTYTYPEYVDTVELLIPAATGSFEYDTTEISVDSIGYHLATITIDTIDVSGVVLHPEIEMAGTVTFTGYTKFYRYLMFEFFTAGNDATGTGIKLDELQLKIWQTQ